MAIKRRTPYQTIDNDFESFIEQADNEVIRKLAIVGERCVNQARYRNKTNGKEYTDQTGNLRSSTGYVIAHNGRIMVGSSFRPIKQGADGSEGKELAERLATEYRKGYVLVVVAGMHYATYVTARGFDVLDSAELLAEKLCAKLDLGIDL